MYLMLNQVRLNPVDNKSYPGEKDGEDMGVDGISSNIVQQAMQMKNLEISSEINTAVTKQAMDQMVEINQQLLQTLPKEDGLGAVLDVRV